MGEEEREEEENSVGEEGEEEGNILDDLDEINKSCFCVKTFEFVFGVGNWILESKVLEGTQGSLSNDCCCGTGLGNVLS
jgi:hypothetical protein